MQTEKVIKRDNKYVLHTYARSQVCLLYTSDAADEL